MDGFARSNLYERRVITAIDAAGKEVHCWGKSDLRWWRAGFGEKEILLDTNYDTIQ
jgi:hypothetical protein